MDELEGGLEEGRVSLEHLVFNDHAVELVEFLHVVVRCVCFGLVWVGKGLDGERHGWVRSVFFLRKRQEYCFV